MENVTCDHLVLACINSICFITFLGLEQCRKAFHLYSNTQKYSCLTPAHTRPVFDSIASGERFRVIMTPLCWILPEIGKRKSTRSLTPIQDQMTVSVSVNLFIFTIYFQMTGLCNLYRSVKKGVSFNSLTRVILILW